MRSGSDRGGRRSRRKGRAGLAKEKADHPEFVETFEGKTQQLLSKKIKTERHLSRHQGRLRFACQPVRHCRRGAQRRHFGRVSCATHLQVNSLGTAVAELKKKLDKAKYDSRHCKRRIHGIEAAVKDAEEEPGKKEDGLKKLTQDFDRFAKLAEQKKWGVGDRFRSLPILDAFASPIRIQQYTLNDLPINYSFKFVTRYDRCTTCHMGIDKAGLHPAGARSARAAEDRAPEGPAARC